DDPSTIAGAIATDGGATVVQAIPAPPAAPPEQPGAETSPPPPAPPALPPSQVATAPPAEAPAVQFGAPGVSASPAPTPALIVGLQGGGMGMAMAAHQFKRPTSGPASRLEWRTPPLWGFRDSAPYLHDGRARTLDQAVSFHGGEATAIAQRYFALVAKER